MRRPRRPAMRIPTMSKMQVDQRMSADNRLRCKPYSNGVTFDGVVVRQAVAMIDSCPFRNKEHWTGLGCSCAAVHLRRSVAGSDGLLEAGKGSQISSTWLSWRQSALLCETARFQPTSTGAFAIHELVGLRELPFSTR